VSIDTIKSAIKASIKVKSQLISDDQLIGQVNNLALRCVDSLRAGGKIMFCGNGGSFADAQHLSAEFTSRFLFDRPGLASITLGTNSSTLTAIGNDYGYENIFSREIEAIGSPNDILFAITTSANSANIINAVGAATRINIPTVVMTGRGRGMLGKEVETLSIPSIDTARIQECHILIGHVICELVESMIYGSES
jgi:D-sedoheptulose 7-phosphate isomerase